MIQLPSVAGCAAGGEQQAENSKKEKKTMMTDADKVAAVKRLREMWIKEIKRLRVRAARLRTGYAQGHYEGRIKALDSVIACLDAEAHMGMELPISGPVL